MSNLQTAIPTGSWVLITGITCHIATHTAEQFLDRGFRVRGTVRDLEKVRNSSPKTSSERSQTGGDLELVHVPDLAPHTPSSRQLRGVSAIAHISSILSFSDDPNEFIPPVVGSVTSILEAALNEPSVKSIVYTSSVAAAVDLTPGTTAYAGPDTWNDEAVEIAWSPPPHASNHRHLVYQASKVLAEKALWAFVRERNPRYAVNVVSPGTVVGGGLHKKHLVSPYPWIKKLYYGNEEIGALFQAIIHVDVKDAALHHVAVVLDPEGHNARLQAWGEYCNVNDILAVLRGLCLERKFMDNFPSQTKHRVTTEYDQQNALLKKWGGQDGWTSLQRSVADEMKGVLK